MRISRSDKHKLIKHPSCSLQMLRSFTKTNIVILRIVDILVCLRVRHLRHVRSFGHMDLLNIIESFVEIETSLDEILNLKLFLRTTTSVCSKMHTELWRRTCRHVKQYDREAKFLLGLVENKCIFELFQTNNTYLLNWLFLPRQNSRQFKIIDKFLLHSGKS